MISKFKHENTKENLVFKENKDVYKYGIQYWLHMTPSLYQWYKTEKERDDAFDKVIKGEPLRITWDYDPQGIGYTDEYPNRVIATNAMKDYGLAKKK